MDSYIIKSANMPQDIYVWMHICSENVERVNNWVSLLDYLSVALPQEHAFFP